MGPAAIEPGLTLFLAWPVGLLFLGLTVMAAIVALTHQRSRAFSPSVVYLALGITGAMGATLLDARLLDLVEDAAVVERLAELTVIVALFATGLRLDRPVIRSGWRSPVLLLAVVMPITIAAVTAFGAGVMGLSLGAAIVLGAALAPTDPVLAGDLGVGPPGQGDEPEASFALTSEAGLNDGLAFPFLYLGLVVAAGASAGDLGEWALWDVAYAVPAGIVLGVGGGRLIAAGATRLRERNLIAAELDGWAAVAAVLAIYGIAEVAGAYGFLAAFAGGLAFRRREAGHEYAHGVHAGAATIERVLELSAILLLGTLVTREGLGAPGWAGWLLAPVLLLAVRPLACAAALRRAPLDRSERLWVGWFGVRGVGSIYYAAAAIGSGLLAPAEGEVVIWTVGAVVMTSILVHGVTADPLSRRLGVRRATPEP